MTSLVLHAASRVARRRVRMVTPDLHMLSASFQESQESLGTKERPPFRISFVSGRLVVNEHVVRSADFRPSAVRWSEKTAQTYTAGRLHLEGNGSLLFGFVAFGKDEHSAVPVPLHAELTPESFTTQFSDRIKEVTGEPAWRSGPDVDLSFALDANGLPGMKMKIGGEEVSPVLRMVNNAVVVDISVDVPDANLPSSAEYTLNWDGTSFEGSYTPSDGAGNSLPTLNWRGSLKSNSTADLEALAGPLHEVDLSLSDLMSLDPAGADSIAQQKFQDYIAYACDDGDRSTLLGIGKPILTPPEQQVIADFASYYQNTLCPAFITYSICRLSEEQGGPKNNLSDAEKLKLKYFWSDGKTLDKNYNLVSSRITQIAYETAQARLSLYVNDSKDWATILHDELKTTPQLNQAVMSFIANNYKLTQINAHSELLLALQPKPTIVLPTKAKCTLASDYHQTVWYYITGRSTARVVVKTDGSARNSPDDIATWIVDWVQRFCTSFATASQPPGGTLTAADYARAHEIAAEVEIEMTHLGGQQALRDIISRELAAGNNDRNLLGALQNFVKNSKFAKGLLKALALAAFMYGLISSISAFKNWSNLSDEQRAQAIVDMVDLGAKLLATIADADPPEIYRALTDWDSVMDDLAEDIARNMFSDLEEGEELFGPVLPGLAESGEGSAGSLFKQMFGEDSTLMEGATVLAAAGAVAFSTYQIYEDFKNDAGATREALDIIIGVANLAALTGTLLLAVGVETTATAALGPIGAAIGLVLALVEMFLPQPEPERPTDKYLDDHGRAFVSSLPAPDANWQPPKQGGAHA
jgi:hypothetical protein